MKRFILLVVCVCMGMSGLGTVAMARTTSSSTASQSAELSPVDINQASVSELSSLKVIGKKRATAIVRYRTDHGFFQDISQLVKVPGITESVYTRMVSQNRSRLVCHVPKKG